jgi:nucleoside-diphosphate-sugar epimerase
MPWSIELYPAEITVNRDERQRRELIDIDNLAASIALCHNSRSRSRRR